MKQVIPLNYQPNDEVLNRLMQSSVDRDFALSLVPEFVIYWSERGERTFSWNSKFLTHVMYEWRRYEIMLAQGRSYIPMTAEWTPNQNTLNALREQNIPDQFSHSVLAEFRIFWIDNGLVTNSWNSKFIGHVRFRWQKHITESRNQPLRQRSIGNELNDRSWATGYIKGLTDGNN